MEDGEQEAAEEEEETDDDMVDAEDDNGGSEALPDTPLKCHEKAEAWIRSDDDHDEDDENDDEEPAAPAESETPAEQKFADEDQNGTDALKDPACIS